MLRSKVRRFEDIDAGDYVYFWRDDMCWLGPAIVLEREDTTVTVLLGGRRKTSGISRAMKTIAPADNIEHEDDTSKAIPPSTTLASPPRSPKVPRRGIPSPPE